MFTTRKGFLSTWVVKLPMEMKRMFKKKLSTFSQILGILYNSFKTTRSGIF